MTGKQIPTEIRGCWGPSEIVIEAGAGSRKKFRMLAYSGGKLALKDYDLPVIVDLKGLTIAAQSMPMLGEHQGKAGESESVTITARGLEIAGFIDAESEDGKLIVAAKKGGFDWEGSIGASVQVMEIYGAGESINVNGQTFSGPVYVARKTTLKETSFVKRGADTGATRVDIAATASKGSSIMSEVTLAVAAERERAKRIEAVFSGLEVGREHGPRLATIKASALAGEIELVDAQSQVLAVIRAARPTGFSTGPGDYRGPSPVSRQTIAASLLVKAGMEALAEKSYGAQVLEASRPLHRRSLVDLAELSLQADGREVPVGRNEMIRAAVSTGTFPVAMSDASNKTLQQAYIESPSTWASFANVKSTPDFKTNHALRPTWAGEVTTLGKDSEIKHGTVGEQDVTWAIDTYAKMYTLDRQSVINDDASIFSDVLPGLARAAKRGLNNLVWRTIMANVGSFFSSGNKNLAAPSGALSAATLAARLTAMRSQTDADDSAIDILPAVLAVPPALEFIAKSIINSAELWQSVAGTPTGNAVQNVVTVEVEPRLSNSAYTGFSATAFYVFSRPIDMPVIVGFLDGNQFPKTEFFNLDADPNVLAFSYRVYHDFGCAYGDFRAAQKADGL